MPFISVIMSIYKERLDWIVQSVDSIINQSFHDFEFIIVVDNPEINLEIREYLSELQKADNRVFVLFNEINRGLAKSLNTALAHSIGKYIARMDADDISINNRLELELKYLEETNADMVSTLRILMNQDGKILGKVNSYTGDPSIMLPISNCIVHPSVLMKSECIKALGGYRYFNKSQDYDLWLRMLTNKYKIVILDEYLIYYRIHDQSISNSNKLEQYYISEYQKCLYRERICKGYDSFSEEKLVRYLRGKNISEEKNKAYTKARYLTDIAIKKYKDRDFSFIFNILEAFIYFPRIPLNTVISVFRLSTKSKDFKRGK